MKKYIALLVLCGCASWLVPISIKTQYNRCQEIDGRFDWSVSYITKTHRVYHWRCVVNKSNPKAKGITPFHLSVEIDE